MFHKIRPILIGLPFGISIGPSRCIAVLFSTQFFIHVREKMSLWLEGNVQITLYPISAKLLHLSTYLCSLANGGLITINVSVSGHV
jgi:hypothetical protein